MQDELNEQIGRYSADDRLMMASAELARDAKKDRVEELIGFCNTHGIRTIGIANCVSFQKESDILVQQLRENGFEVHDINCKMARIPSSEFVPEAKGIACNPIGQANFLAEHATQLNLSVGLCVGHDILFNMHTKAPVSTLLVKDRMLKHRTIDRF